MKQLILVSVCLASALGFKDFNMDHQHDAREAHDHKNCVDISYYDNVEYNTTITKMCGYKKNTDCVPRKTQVCRDIPVTECRIVGFTECEETPYTQTVSDDALELETFVAKDCQPGPVKVLNETKKMPECTTVTKQQCDSKWEINANGEKVWAGNENCKDVTWEDCKLVDKQVEEEVEVYSCDDDTTQTYLEPVVKEEEVTARWEECHEKGGAVCSVTNSSECTTVEWTDCEEKVEEECHDVTMKVPSQEYDHLLRCINH